MMENHSALTQIPPGEDFADVMASVRLAHVEERIKVNIPGSNGIDVHAKKSPDRPSFGPIGISAKSGDAQL